MSDAVTNDGDQGSEGDKSVNDGTVLADAIKPEGDKDGTVLADAIKPEGDEADAAAAKEAADKEAAGAPEAYEDFKLPEGMEALEVMGEFKDLAKKHDLSQEAAQELVDIQTKIMQDQQQANVDFWENQKTEWLATSKKDKEIGGDKFDASVDGAKLTLQKFGTPALVEMFETYGLGNHPEIIRFAARINAAVGEDTIMSGDAAKGTQTAAQRMYPDNPSKGA